MKLYRYIGDRLKVVVKVPEGMATTAYRLNKGPSKRLGYLEKLRVFRHLGEVYLGYASKEDAKIEYIEDLKDDLEEIEYGLKKTKAEIKYYTAHLRSSSKKKAKLAAKIKKLRGKK